MINSTNEKEVFGLLKMVDDIASDLYRGHYMILSSPNGYYGMYGDPDKDFMELSNITDMKRFGSLVGLLEYMVFLPDEEFIEHIEKVAEEAEKEEALKVKREAVRLLNPDKPIRRRKGRG